MSVKVDVNNVIKRGTEVFTRIVSSLRSCLTLQ